MQNLSVVCSFSLPNHILLYGYKMVIFYLHVLCFLQRKIFFCLLSYLFIVVWTHGFLIYLKGDSPLIWWPDCLDRVAESPSWLAPVFLCRVPISFWASFVGQQDVSGSPRALSPPALESPFPIKGMRAPEEMDTDQGLSARCAHCF